MAEVTITIVGAGSHTFTPGLMSDLCQTPDLAGSTLRLYDIDARAAERMRLLGQRMAVASGAELSLEVADGLVAALEDTDHVITTVAVGGLPAWRKDLEIPARHGIVQPVGDSVGPGGISRALRVIPAIVEVAEAMESLCPAALLINYSNPMTAICHAVSVHTVTPVLGLCHGIMGTAGSLANVMGIPVEEISVLAGGVNHFTWITELQRGPEDLYPLLAEKASAAESLPSPLSFALWDRYGAFPSPGDRHVAEFLPFFCRPGGDGKLPYGLFMLPIDAYEENQRNRAEHLAAAAAGDGDLQALMGRSGEQAIEIISCLANGRPRFLEATNVPNRGAIDGLPDDAIVETPALVGPLGLRPCSPDPLPAGVMPFLAARCLQVRLIGEAAVNGNRDAALEAMLADPMVTDFDSAEPMLEALLEAHAEHLPQF